MCLSGAMESKEFDVKNGVKQGCVLGLTLVSLYLAAIFEVAFSNVTEGICIQTCDDANLFKVSHFKTGTKTSLKMAREMLYADDSALVAHGEQDMQRRIDRFSQTAGHFSLKVNIRKIEFLYQPEKLLSVPTIQTENKISIKTLCIYVALSQKIVGSKVN